jgi:hypothetical protein
MAQAQKIFSACLFSEFPEGRRNWPF